MPLIAETKRIINELTERQTEAAIALSIDSKYDVVGYGGAKGGGKSRFARIWLAMRAENYPGSTGLLLRRSYQEVYRNHVRNFLDEYPHCSYREQKHEIIFPNGSVIELGYAENDSDIERYHGVEYQHVVIDQAEQNPKRLYYNIRSCMRSGKGIIPKMLLTFNPGGQGHSWLKKMFIDRIPEKNEDLNRVKFIKATVYDNPHINKEYIESLMVLPDQLREAYLGGNFDVFEGQFFNVYPQSFEEPFVIAAEEARDRLYGALDHGISHHTSFSLNYLDRNGIIHRLFSYYNNGGNAKLHAEEIRQRIESFIWSRGYMPVKIFADPSMWTTQKVNEKSYSIIDEYKNIFKGTTVQFVKANNQKENGCALCRDVLTPVDGAVKFKYWKKFNNELADILSSMVADVNKPEQYLKVDGDDMADEFRYSVVGMLTEYNSQNKIYENSKPFILNNSFSQFTSKELSYNLAGA